MPGRRASINSTKSTKSRELKKSIESMKSIKSTKSYRSTKSVETGLSHASTRDRSTRSLPLIRSRPSIRSPPSTSSRILRISDVDDEDDDYGKLFFDKDDDANTDADEDVEEDEDVSVTFTVSEGAYRMGEEEVDLLRVHRWPKDPNQLSNDDLESWISLFRQDNKTIETEITMMETYWMNTRSKAQDSLETQTSMDDYINLSVGCGHRQTAHFQMVRKEMQIDETRTKVGTMVKSVSSSKGASNFFLKRAIWSLDKDARSTSSAFSGITGVGSSLEEGGLTPHDRLEISMCETRRRKAERRRRRQNHEEVVDDLECRTENWKIQLNRFKNYQKKFYKDVLHTQDEVVKEKLDRRIISGKSILKWHDDVLKEKNRHKDLLLLSNQNLKKDNKKLHLTLQELEEAERGNKLTVVDIEELKVLARESSLIVNERAAEVRNLTNLLGECIFGLKKFWRKLEAAEEENEKMEGKLETMRRTDHTTDLAIDTMCTRRDTCTSENNQYCKLLRNTVKIPDVVDYAQQVERSRLLREEILAWERKIRIKEMELKNLEGDLRKRRSTSSTHASNRSQAKLPAISWREEDT